MSQRAMTVSMMSPTELALGALTPQQERSGFPDGDRDVLVTDIARVPEDLIADLGLGLDIHKHSAE